MYSDRLSRYLQLRRFRFWVRLRTVVTLLCALYALAAGGVAGAAEWLAVGTQFGKVFDRAPNGEYVGFAVDLLRAIARQSGDTVRFEIYPWARAQALVELGKADILIGPYKTAEREQRFYFSERAFYQDEMVFYARANSRMTWAGHFGSLRGRHIVAVNGWAYGTAFEHVREELGVTTVDTLQQGLQMLAMGRIELLATNRRNTDFLLPQLHLTVPVVALEPIIETQNGYFAFPKSREHEELRRRFNQAWTLVSDSGEFVRLARLHDVHTP